MMESAGILYDGGLSLHLRDTDLGQTGTQWHFDRISNQLQQGRWLSGRALTDVLRYAVISCLYSMVSKQGAAVAENDSGQSHPH